MTARAIVVYQCDRCGRTAEVEPVTGEPVGPPAGWSMAATGAVTCDRHEQPAPAPIVPAKLRLGLPVIPLPPDPTFTVDAHALRATLRALGPGPIPFVSAHLDMAASKPSTWTFVVPADFVEVELDG